MNKTLISNLQYGKYQVNSLIGTGGFGNTYLAVQVALGRKVAIKEFFMKEYCERDEATSQVIVPTEGSRQIVERYRQKFLKEAQMIASLKNDHIIQIYDIFEENNTAYYVMEYVEGGSLKDKVNLYGPLTESTAKRYISQVSDALSYLHSNNILHLDIKPSNILIGNEDKVLLIDFGISKHYDADGGQTSTTPAGISKGFAPIEQYQQGSISGFTPSTDIYSLGATLYFLLTGQTPPEASVVNEDGLPDCINTLSPNTRSLIQKSMSPRRKDRFQSVEEFISSLKSSGTSRMTDNTTSNVDEATIINSDTPKVAKKEPERPTVTPTHDTAPKSRITLIISIVAGLLVIALFAFKLFKQTDAEIIAEEVEDISTVVPVVLEAPDFEGMTLSNPKKLSYSLKQEARTSNNISDDDVWKAKYHSPQQGTTYEFRIDWRDQPDDNLKSKVPEMSIGKYRSYVKVASQYNVIAYGDDSLDPTLIVVTDTAFNKILHAYDFGNFSLERFSQAGDIDFTKISVENVQIENDVLYATLGHSTYASTSSGYNAYLVAIDLKSQKVKWMTEPLTSNSPFCIYGDTIITGYGFSGESDNIYIVDKSTGCRLKSIKVSNAPEYFSIIGDKLYVRTYSYDYVFRLEEVKNENLVTSQSKTASTNSTNKGDEIEEEPIPYQLVETKPTFQGGDAHDFSEWVNLQLRYPDEARENDVQGRVTLQFTVQKNGAVTNVKLLRGVHPALDNEAIRVLSMSPKWEPGKHHGRIVPVTYTFPVIFQLN